MYSKVPKVQINKVKIGLNVIKLFSKSRNEGQMKSKQGQNTVKIQSKYIQSKYIQSKYIQLKYIQSKLSQNTVTIHTVKIHTVKIKSKYSQNTVKIQLKYSQNTVKMQPKCSPNPVKMQSKCSHKIHVLSGVFYVQFLSCLEHSCVISASLMYQFRSNTYM